MPNLQDLANLAQSGLDQADQEIVRELCEKYGVPFEGGETPTEDPIDESNEEKEIVEEIPVEEPPIEEPVDVVPEEISEEAPVEPEIPEEPPVEEVPVPPEADPVAEIKGLVASVTQEIAGLKAEIENLKSLLESVAVREPLSEDEADKLESESSVGKRVKGSPANVPEQSVATDLIKKLGGYSR